jgi:hypothetical protein
MLNVVLLKKLTHFIKISFIIVVAIRALLVIEQFKYILKVIVCNLFHQYQALNKLFLRINKKKRGQKSSPCLLDRQRTTLSMHVVYHIDVICNHRILV